jgi:hypothetical protein
MSIYFKNELNSSEVVNLINFRASQMYRDRMQARMKSKVEEITATLLVACTVY